MGLLHVFIVFLFLGLLNRTVWTLWENSPNKYKFLKEHAYLFGIIIITVTVHFTPT
jgi:hypothetical protein